LKWLVNGASDGDHLFFHYSGHGSQQDDTDGDEMSGKDDTLVPVDYQQAGMISDDELRSILVTNLPKGVRLTVILDCCHSGTALDLPYKIGVDASNMVEVKKKLPHQMKLPSNGDVVMLSGCMDTQTSADAGVGLAGNTQSSGAMTTAFKVTIAKKKDISFHELIIGVRGFLKTQGFQQVPQLSSEHSLNLGDCFMPEWAPPAAAMPPATRLPVRKALSIGINYYVLPAGQGQLSGCINDSDTMIGVLKEVFQFQDSQIRRLRDDRKDMMPTKANILASFRWLTDGAQPGDDMFLHYSGHGGQQRDTNGDEASGQDDTLIPCDFQSAGQIIDDELYSLLVQQLPKGCRLWVLLDCCHSGTALDLPYKVQISEDGKSVKCSSVPQKGGIAGQPSEAEVIMISGCKDEQTSADVQAGSMGVLKAAGAMTTAFRHSITPTISVHDLLYSMRAFLKQNSFEQVPQMSSENFVQLESSFVTYAARTPQGNAAASPGKQAAPSSPLTPGAMYGSPASPQIGSPQSPWHVGTPGATKYNAYAAPQAAKFGAVAAQGSSSQKPPNFGAAAAQGSSPPKPPSFGAATAQGSSPSQPPSFGAVAAQGSSPPQPPNRRGRQRAVTVGINYIGMQCQLAGCINDSHTFVDILTGEFCYDVADIRQLRDDNAQGRPTRKNITTALKWLVNGSSDGDHLFFHYSGHGSQQSDTDGDEMDGKDDTLVPVDYQQAGMLSDDELRSILVTGLPKGVRLTVILDCCHSGTALDLPYKINAGLDSLVEVKKKLPHQTKPPSSGDVVMLSGCRDTQTSADAGVGLAGNTQASGAMTTAFKVTVAKHKAISFHDMITGVRNFLKTQGFKQEPQLSSEHCLNLGDCFLPEWAPPHVAPPKPLRPTTRKALTIGINYYVLPQGQGQLSGCINDSDTMIGALKEVFNFQDSQIMRLRDDRHDMMPTRANVLASFRWLTEGAQPGDDMFLHYSGHGGQQKDTNGDEATGQDDTLIPCDFQSAGQIIDDDLYSHLVQNLPKGCRLWVMLDCCHSGTALDLPFKAQLSDDGRSVKCAKEPRKSGAPPSEADVIMISGCQDTQTSADVQAGSMGAAKAAGAMTTAFRHCVNPSISCEDLLVGMRSFLKQNRYEQVPQMSSEQFMQMDSSFVNYAGKNGGSAAPAAASSAPFSPSTPVNGRLGGQASPHQYGATNDHVTTRISTLQQQIAELRKNRLGQMSNQDYPLHQPIAGSPGVWHSAAGQPGLASPHYASYSPQNSPMGHQRFH